MGYDPAAVGQQQQVIETFTLFLWNQGRAPARDVYIGHFFLPAHNVFPDIPRQIVPTPGGGMALQFGMVPPRTVVSISYLMNGAFTVQNVLSCISSEDGTAKHIPVMLQRIWPKWLQRILVVLLFAGIWVAVNVAWSLISFLWRTYYAK